MVDWVAVQAVATVVLVLTSAGAIGYASLQLKHERAYRSAANLEKQLAFFLGEAFGGARRRLAAARLTKVDSPDSESPDSQSPNSQSPSSQSTDQACAKPALVAWNLDDPPVSAFEVLDFYEHLALLVKKVHLDLYDVWHTFYEWAQPVYVDMQPLIESPDSAYCDHYNDLERLMRRMDEIQLKKMHAKRANHWALWTVDRIIEHYQYELEVGSRPRTRRRRVGTAGTQAARK